MFADSIKAVFDAADHFDILALTVHIWVNNSPRSFMYKMNK